MSSRNDISQNWKDFETQFTAFREKSRKSLPFDTSIALRRLYSLSFVCEKTRLLLKGGNLTERLFAAEVRWLHDYLRAFNECHRQSGEPQFQVPDDHKHSYESLYDSWNALYAAMWRSPCVKLASAPEDPLRVAMWRRAPRWNRKMGELAEDMRGFYPSHGPATGKQTSGLSVHSTKSVSNVDDGTIPGYPPPTYDQATQGGTCSWSPTRLTDDTSRFTFHSM
jgi:hypothetical protein